ncbi:MAG: hypothetical protein WAT19_13155 [Ferruginibacter sp.]
MNSRKFLYTYTIITVLLAALLAGINYYIDIYGLFRGKKERKVYINERTSKYLFSMRYIPENYEGFIAGPSLSANLNPEQIKEFKIYNASIMGINVTEMNYLVDNIIDKGHMKFAIICLGRYLTKDHGRKSANIDPKEYYGALGSTNLLKTYLLYAVRKYNWAPGRYAANVYNTAGWNNFELEMKNLHARDTIEKRAALKIKDTISIDTVAYRELDYILKRLRSNNIKVIGYYSPVPYKLYEVDKAAYLDFEKEIGKLFNDQDVLLNLNDEKYKAENDDYNNFIDHGHLSANGQKFVLNELGSVLKQLYPNK